MDNDIRIAGSGKISEGEYNEIRISGSAKIAGNVKCAGLSAAGSVSCEGSAECSGEVRISGSGRFEGRIDAQTVKVSGALKCVDASFETMEISGALSCAGKLKGKTFKCGGAVKAEAGIECESVTVNGAVSCAGLINADEVKIVLDGKSCAESIGGGKITVSRPENDPDTRGGFFRRLFRKSSGTLEVSSSVEGDVIDISFTKAQTVSGRSVKIGSGCEIGTVRYADDIEIAPDAKVEKTEKA